MEKIVQKNTNTCIFSSVSAGLAIGISLLAIYGKMDATDSNKNRVLALGLSMTIPFTIGLIMLITHNIIEPMM